MLLRSSVHTNVKKKVFYKFVPSRMGTEFYYEVFNLKVALNRKAARKPKNPKLTGRTPGRMKMNNPKSVPSLTAGVAKFSPRKLLYCIF